MQSIHIVGGRPLCGEVRLHGAKNAALPILTAAVGISGVFTLRNCPRIRDVEATREILGDLGVESAWEGDALRVDSRGRHNAVLRPELAAATRTSSLLLGALTGAWGHAEVPFPGGCVLGLGLRPLDLHLEAFAALGIRHSSEGCRVRCDGRPAGGTVVLPYPSVGATENVLLAALGASGPVQLIGAAREPEIRDLAAFLNACGAEITGAGSSRIRIWPAPLHGADYSILPDRMEAVTWLCAAACAGGRVTLDAGPETFRPVLEVLRRAGCKITEAPDRLTLESGRLRAPGSLKTGPYPAFPTDAQPLIMAAMARAEGVTVLEETVFKNRFFHVDALRAMGADIEVAGSTARIRGVRALHGAEVEATDLRGGAAMVCAALGAEGESRIRRADLLSRGYAELPQTLRRLGAEIAVED